jgi:hypothetical protein
MRLLLLLAWMLAGCAASPRAMSPNGQDELAHRTAGETRRCVPIQPAEPLRISQSDPHILLYGTGKTVWVNHLPKDCGFRYGDVIVSQPIGSSHCRGDLVRSFDNFTHIPGNACVLGDFMAYNG